MSACFYRYKEETLNPSCVIFLLETNLFPTFFFAANDFLTRLFSWWGGRGEFATSYQSNAVSSVVGGIRLGSVMFFDLRSSISQNL